MAEGEPNRVWDEDKNLETLTPSQRRKERKERKSRKRRRGKLRFRFHRDYDIAQPHAEGFVILRVFAPIKPIRPDHRVAMMRCEMRDGGEIRAVYTGCVDTDLPRLDDIDLQKVYFAGGEAKAELHALQLKWDEDPRSRRRSSWPKDLPRLGNLSFGTPPELMPKEPSLLGNMLERGLPVEVVQAVKDLDVAADSTQLKAAEDRLAPFVEETVDTSIEPPQKVRLDNFVQGLFD